MLSIQPVGVNSTLAFKAHLPKTFASMMNYIYKKTPEDMFQYKDVMHVETILEDGREIGGIVTFLHGKYNGLIMDEGFENLRQEFMRTALKRYNKHIADRQLQEKLGYLA